MKKIFVIITSLFVLASCSSTKEAQSTTELSKSDKKIASRAKVQQAVESKRYILKFDHLYFSNGGMASIYPRMNYIIIDREKAIISTVYIGRQYDIRPIAAISVHGKSTNYQVTENLKKGTYEVNMKVDNGTNKFDVYITIGRDGYCSASINNLYTDHIRYNGYLVPIREDVNIPLQKNDVI